MTQQLALALLPRPEPGFADFYAGRNTPVIEALAESLSGGERFILIWGEAGSGKSHLLRALVAEARRLSIAARYVGPPHAGLAHPVAVREVLAVDDVARLDATAQLALFDRFNAARAGEGSVVCASDCPPSELALREELRTRLGAGLVMRVHALEDAEQIAALAWHAASRGMRLPPGVAEYLATHCRRDMGTRMAVLDALDRLSLEQQRAVTLPLLRDSLKALFGAEPANG